MTADSSTSAGEAGGSVAVSSPSPRRSLPSPWAQVVRGGCEPELIVPRSPPLVAGENPVFSDQLAAIEPETVAQPEGAGGDVCGNAGGVKKAWFKPSENGVVEGTTTATTTPVMGAASWPALSESTRPVQKSSSWSESSCKPSPDESVTVSQAPAISHPPQKPAKISASPHTNTNNTHPVRHLSMKRGGGAGGASAGYNRPPPPPPLPPPFPLFDLYGNLVPAVLDSSVREPSFKGNGWVPRPMGGVGSPPHAVHDHSSNRNRSRRNNFGPRPRGDGGLYVNNGYGGRHDHHGPRSPATRDVHVPLQMVPPPPPFPRVYIRQPHPGVAPYIAAQPMRPYGAPMGYEMAAPFLYVPTLPPESYRSAPVLPHAAPPSMFTPAMDPPLHVRILNQIEYYFSDANLVKDNFLRSNMDDEGWVPITLIAGFRRVQSLTTDQEMILNSLKDSSAVEVQGDKVRRRHDWNKWVQHSERSLAKPNSHSSLGTAGHSVEQIPIQNLTLEEVTTNEKTISDAKENDAQNQVEASDVELN